MIIHNRDPFAQPKFQVKDEDFHAVGGYEGGVFGVWVEECDGMGKCSSGLLVHLAAGDDGHWWHIDSFDSEWLPGFINAMQLAQRDVDTALAKKRKTKKGRKVKG
jgi:hypothetical protein